ncbi:MAG: MMPL family transporter [Lysinibacillus sp.]
MKNKRTLAAIFWLVAVIIMLIVMPDLNKLVQEKGQVTLPNDLESVIGTEILNDMTNEGRDTYSFAYVFHQKDGLSDADFSAIEQTLNGLDTQSLGITDTLFHTESEAVADQLISKDGTTVLAQLAIDKSLGTASEVAELLRDEVDDLNMDTYVTGPDIVIDDFTTTTQEGVKKTEIIAVIFIITILVIIFRSPVVPAISLITVGVAYVISLSTVALLTKHFDFPFSNFTQVFLVVILFGIGTDYNILLFTRFKEELARTNHVLKAISNTYKTAGKTVLFSGCAVFIGFTALYFSQFSMYKATSGVAIGVFVLLIVLMTLNPFFMGLLGFKLFWPIKEIHGHSENKLWAFLSNWSFTRPLFSIVLVLLVSVPFIYTYTAELNYNDLVEIDNKYESKQAITVIEKHYVAGMSAPSTLVIQNDESLATNNYLKAIDELTRIIANTPGVAKVYSPTRPEGKRIEDLYVNEQASTLEEGLNEAQEGVGTINEGLNDVTESLSEKQDLSGVQSLIDGTSALQNGASQLSTALNELTAGLGDAQTGSSELASGASNLQNGLTELQSGVNQLQQAYSELSVGFSQFSPFFTQVEQLVASSKQAYEGILASMNAYIQTNPDAANNEYIQTTIGIAQQGLQSLNTLDVATLSSQYNQLTTGMSQANAALTNAQAGIDQLQAGASQLVDGANGLSTGIGSATSGAEQIAAGSTALSNGLSDVQNGQQQLQQSLLDLQANMQALKEGLGEGAEGLSEIYNGLSDANSYLAELSAKETGTFFIPQEVLEGEFQESLDAYMTDDRTGTTFNIVLDVNPYTEQAMDVIRNVDERIDGYVESSILKNAAVYVTGKTMNNADLQDVSSADFIRSAIIMMVGISVVLWIITRSFLQTLVIDASLLLATFASLGLTELIAKHLIGYEMLSWNVPFFTYIMIVSLGVDYSIFLMMRYNETAELGRSEIVKACTQMGGVILSAAIILGGTFAALIPSGIITLIQVAIAVVIGLVILAVFIMPMFIPACLGVAAKVEEFMANRKNKD